MITRPVFVALIGTLLLGCQPSSEVPEDARVVRNGEAADQSIPSELRVAMDAFYAAIEGDDHEARIALFTEEAVMMPDGGPRLEGRAAIAEVIRGGAGSVFRIRDREIVDMDSGPNLAYTVNSYSYTYHAQGSEPSWQKTKNVHIWKKDPTGAWKLHVDIWNSDG